MQIQKCSTSLPLWQDHYSSYRHTVALLSREEPLQFPPLLRGNYRERQVFIQSNPPTFVTIAMQIGKPIAEEAAAEELTLAIAQNASR